MGELYNEVPDRVSDSAIFIGAGYAVGSAPMLGALTACVALFIAYVRAEGKVAGAPQEFCGPMAKPQRMFVMTLCALYCGLAPLAWQPWVTMVGQHWGVMAAGLMLIIVGGLWTLVRRLSRIARALKPHYVKDLGGILPGHGGLLDRVDSLVLVVPPVFHYRCFQPAGIASK